MTTYHVAQRFVSIEPDLPEIGSWVAVAPPKELRPALACLEAIHDEHVFCGDGQLGIHRRHIDCRWSRQGYALRVGGVGEFLISADGRRITGQPIAGLSPGDLIETVLGPAVTLALALQGVWCFHASAVESAGEVIAFVGESGAGKSTLARELPGLDLALRCAADDVLPVALEGEAARALPRFPQLKYRFDQQPGSALPACLPLTRIYVLDSPSDQGQEVEALPLGGYAAVLALVRHTVAARLFTEDLLKRHVEFCAQLTDHIEVHRLRYPHRPGVLPQVKEMLFSQGPKCSP